MGQSSEQQQWGRPVRGSIQPGKQLEQIQGGTVEVGDKVERPWAPGIEAG